MMSIRTAADIIADRTKGLDLNEHPVKRKSKKPLKTIRSRRPKYMGKGLQGHHAYNVSKYPHLADKGAVIYPATFNEHLYGWHGGNFSNSLPGRPIRNKRDF